MLKQTFSVWLLLLGSHTLAVQPPEPWTMGEFPPAKGSYEYRLATGPNEAQTRQSFELDLCRESGVTVSAKTVGHQMLDQVSGAEENRQFTGFSVDCQGGKVWCYKVKDYRDAKGNVYMLYEVSKKGDFRPYTPVYRRVNDYSKPTSIALSFVPFGAAQFYKGNKGAGTFFLVSQATAVVATGVLKWLANGYYNDYLNERNPTQRENYKRLSENADMMFLAALGATGGLYVGGILHGLFADGKRKKWDVAMAPYATPKNTGLALAVNF